MLDLGWSELLVIGIVALIVVGPKDLPILFRRAGQFTARIKGMAREFSKAMNDAADETGVRDLAKTMQSAADPLKAGANHFSDQFTGPLDPSELAGEPEETVKPVSKPASANENKETDG